MPFSWCLWKKVEPGVAYLWILFQVWDNRGTQFFGLGRDHCKALFMHDKGSLGKQDNEGVSSEPVSDGMEDVVNISIDDGMRVIEERPDWGEFHGSETDEFGGYRMPTPEESESFKKRIERMAEIFEGADFQWFLDGAMNISLYRGEQIRAHKDIDMSVFEEDLSRLDEFLSKRGFGIFANAADRRTMRRLTGTELVSSCEPDLSICKIGQDGRIESDRTEPFNFVDLHVNERDSEGNVSVPGGIGISLPKEYFIPIRKPFENGKEIFLSHPAVVAYHKLCQGRPHDFTDLKRLRKYLDEKDLGMLREIFKKEAEVTDKAVDIILVRIWDSLSKSKALFLSRDPKVVSEILWEDPDINGMSHDERVTGYADSISSYVSEHPKISYDDFRRQSVLILGNHDRFDMIMRRLNELEGDGVSE